MSRYVSFRVILSPVRVWSRDRDSMALQDFLSHTRRKDYKLLDDCHDFQVRAKANSAPLTESRSLTFTFFDSKSSESRSFSQCGPC